MIHNSIVVQGITKKFSFPVKKPEVSWWRNLFFPDQREIVAVNNISFSVKEGERIAFIGPNGAGKSTTIKMLTGIITPTEGSALVLGLNPNEDRKKLAYQIGTVFGQRSQLLPNLPLRDSLEFFGVMYDLSNQRIAERIDELSQLFELGEFIDQPVRKLSLGQRMRGEIAASLMHKPKIILLDEPTIGLDVVAKKSLRDLLLKINAEEKTTIFLTSHDVGDIETLCERTIVINHGTVVSDLPTTELAKAFAYEKYVDLIPHEHFQSFPDLPKGITYRTRDMNKVTVVVNVNTLDLKQALKKLLELFEVEDVDVYSADLETVIRHIYERDSIRI